MHTGFVGRGYIVWFGQYTEIAFLVSLFGYTQPISVGVQIEIETVDWVHSACQQVMPFKANFSVCSW